MTELPPGWAPARVGEIAELTDGPFGSNLKTAHYTESGPRVVRLQNIGHGVFRGEPAHIAEDHYKRLIKHAVGHSDIVVASLGEDAPRACLVPHWLGPAIVKADCIRLRTRDGIDPSFLMWMLNSPLVRAQAAPSIKGVGRPRLGLGGIRRLSVPIPPPHEQRRIVAAIEEQFSRLDAAEESLAAAKAKLRALRTESLASATSGYALVDLGSVVLDLRYGTSIKCTREPVGPPVLRIPNVQRGRVDLGDLKFATDPRVDLSAFAVEPGDLLFVRTNGSRDLIGRLAAVEHADGFAFASYLIRARPDLSRLEPKYAVYALSTPSQRAAIEAKAATTAGQYNLNLAALRSLSISLPPLADQRRIVANLERRLSLLDALSVAIESAHARSAALRRSILERAFTGKLVPQDPSDEPASVLLERIAAERAASAQPRRAGRSARAAKA